MKNEIKSIVNGTSKHLYSVKLKLSLEKKKKKKKLSRKKQNHGLSIRDSRNSDLEEKLNKQA